MHFIIYRDFIFPIRLMELDAYTLEIPAEKRAAVLFDSSWLRS